LKFQHSRVRLGAEYSVYLQKWQQGTRHVQQLLYRTYVSTTVPELYQHTSPSGVVDGSLRSIARDSRSESGSSHTDSYPTSGKVAIDSSKPTVRPDVDINGTRDRDF
jgi:hypothetical protein